MSRRYRNILQDLRELFSGKHSEAGKRIYERWFDSFDDTKGLLDELDEHEQIKYSQHLFEDLNTDLDLSSSVKPVAIHGKVKQRFKNGSLYRVAAILVVGLLLSTFLTERFISMEPQVEPVEIVEKSNLRGQISEIVLPDGSTVWLGAASSLEYPETFSDEERTVSLTGEAYFDIESDITRPFVVESGPISTVVTGTSFNVKAYQEDETVEITLLTGSVEVTSRDEGVTRSLQPDQRISWEKSSGLGVAEATDAAISISWIDHEFLFIRDSFRTIAKTFERWYGVDFIFMDEDLAEETFVYHFRGLSLENSLKVLNEMADFNYEISGRQVYITGNCSDDNQAK